MGGQATSLSSVAASTSNESIEKEVQALFSPSLTRLTKGLPQHELKLIMMEAEECEEALLKEIKILEEAMDSPSNSDGSSSTKSKAGKNNEHDPNNSLAMGGWAYDAMEGLNHHSSVDAMTNSEITPADRFFSVSALLGRLRQPLHLPPIPQASEFTAPPEPPLISTSSSGSNNTTKSNHKKKSSSKKSDRSGNISNSSSNTNNAQTHSNTSSNTSSISNAALEKQQLHERKQNLKFIEKQKALLDLENNQFYYKTLEQPQLLALWKRISSHRTAAVFRKPVSAKDAPGYEDRILFPIDMSLIRKMIVAGIISSYSDLHQRIGLICHNCVKFNGRESDYGVITREFEMYVDDVMTGLVAAAAAQASSTSSQQSSSSNAGLVNDSSK